MREYAIATAKELLRSGHDPSDYIFFIELDQKIQEKFGSAIDASVDRTLSDRSLESSNSNAISPSSTNATSLELGSDNGHASKNEVMLVKSGGVYKISAMLNDVLVIKFILDSGASDVFISPDIALTLLKTETIRESDWLPGQIYQPG